VIGVAIDCPFTPAMLKKVAYAGSQSASFVGAPQDLEALAETKVSRERVQRWTKRVGEERIREAEASSEQYQALTLPEQRKSLADQVPPVVVPPVACVMADGGRIQIRKRGDSLEEKNTGSKGYWRETLVKSVVATRAGQAAFGKRLVSEAHARGFNAAKRKAFVADGAASNWTIHRKHFSHYTPVVDFTHAICYVYAAAMAGRTCKAAWHDYVQWAQWLWNGQTDQLIAAVQAQSEPLGAPLDGDESSPATIVARTLGYLKNQRTRMKYAEYRKLGLPITSSHIESTIKQINRRVKGTEKSWDQGAEPLLQLAADHISETNDFDRFWKRRHRRLLSMRRQQDAA